MTKTEKSTVPTPWLTMDEAAAYLKISRSQLSRYVNAGEVDHHTLGRQKRFSVEQLDNFVRKHVAGSPGKKRALTNNGDRIDATGANEPAKASKEAQPSVN